MRLLDFRLFFQTLTSVAERAKNPIRLNIGTIFFFFVPIKFNFGNYFYIGAILPVFHSFRKISRIFRPIRYRIQIDLTAAMHTSDKYL